MTRLEHTAVTRQWEGLRQGLQVIMVKTQQLILYKHILSGDIQCCWTRLHSKTMYADGQLAKLHKEDANLQRKFPSQLFTCWLTMGCCFSIGVEVIGLLSSLSSSSSSLACSSSVVLSLDAGGLAWLGLGKSPSPPNLGTSCDPASTTAGDCSNVGEANKGATCTGKQITDELV